MASATVKQPEKTLWDHVSSYLLTNALTVGYEMQRLVPDSLLFGSFIMYFLSGNTTWGVLTLFLFETVVLAHTGIAAGFQAYQGFVGGQKDVACRPGFRQPRFDLTRFFIRDRYPSVGLFTVGALATYMASTIGYFTDTLRAMGTEWQSRITVSYIFIALLLVLFVLIHSLSGCETMGEIITAIICGVVVGILLFYINFLIFGAEGINILGLPLLVDKSQTSTPIYVCLKENSNQ